MSEFATVPIDNIISPLLGKCGIKIITNPFNGGIYTLSVFNPFTKMHSTITGQHYRNMANRIYTDDFMYFNNEDNLIININGNFSQPIKLKKSYSSMEDLYLHLVSSHYHLFNKIDIKYQIEILKNIKQTHEFAVIALIKEPKLIDYIDNELKTPELYLDVVKVNGNAIKCFPKNQYTYKLCIEALSHTQNSNLLNWIPNKFIDFNLYHTALTYVPSAIVHIKIPDPDHPKKLYGPNNSLNLDKYNELLVMAAVLYKYTFKHITKYQPLIYCMIAITSFPDALKYIINQDEIVCLAAAIQDGYTLMYVHNQTHQICMRAVAQNGLALRFVKHQTFPICATAIKNNINALLYVNKEFKDDCKTAISEFNTKIHYNMI